MLSIGRTAGHVCTFPVVEHNQRRNSSQVCVCVFAMLWGERVLNNSLQCGFGTIDTLYVPGILCIILAQYVRKAVLVLFSTQGPCRCRCDVFGLFSPVSRVSEGFTYVHSKRRVERSRGILFVINSLPGIYTIYRTTLSISTSTIFMFVFDCERRYYFTTECYTWHDAVSASRAGKPPSKPLRPAFFAFHGQ